ncbi:MAG: [protein-PII] uridylyltransferase [Armatimonadaceae bacterium]
MTSMTPASALRQELQACADEKSLVSLVNRERVALRERWNPQMSGRAWMLAHAALMDAILQRLFLLSLERNDLPADTGDNGIAVIATGGYGQRMLAPGSDMDITVLVARDDDRPVLRSFFSLVMDVLLAGAKIKVGYAYRPLADAEAATLDHQTQTSLLNARYLAGDSGLFARFDRLFLENLQTAAFLFEKEREFTLRREKYGGSPFVAEPDIKNGPGGMRDLQTASWMGFVRYRRPGESLFRELVRRKVITREELRDLLAAREFLLTVRCAMHLPEGERRDLLTRMRQEETATKLGYDNPDAFGRRYFENAITLYRLADKVVQRCLESPLSLGEAGLSAVRRRIAITEPEQASADPDWSLKALYFCQRHNLELALATEEAAQREVRDSPWSSPDDQRRVGRRFLQLLTLPGDTGATLRRMRRTGLMMALLPELEACMGIVPPDPTHQYTVGEHSLCVLDNLIRLRETVSDSDPHLGKYRGVLLSLEEPLPLYLAALFHDLGKQWSHLLSGERAPHEETGAERVVGICERLGCPPEVTQITRFLVRHHLLLAEISRLRDLGRTETIREVAQIVGDSERLRMLYLLTYADTSAVGPGVFTEMNADLLEELFLRTDDLLNRAGGAEPPIDSGVRDRHLETVRERLQRRLTQARVNPDEISEEAIREHIRAMPAAYLLNTPLETMSRHLAMVQRLRDGEPLVVDMRTITGSALTELTVVTHDDPVPGLLAKITGALLSCDVYIHTAQVFTREMARGELLAVDVLQVDYRGMPLTREKRGAVESALQSVLRNEKTVEELLARRRRGLSAELSLRAFQVETAPDAEYTLVDVEAPDDVGVVFRLSNLFTGWGWNILAARVSAWGGNVRLAFYLTDAADHPIPSADAIARLQSVFDPENAD